MRKRRLMSTATLLLAPGAAALALLACSSGSSGVQHGDAGGMPEAGADVLADQQSNDAQPSGEAGPTDRMHMVAVNNLVPVLSSVRLCVVASASGDPGPSDVVAMDPQPAAPGLAPGRLAPIDVPTSIAGKNVRVFVYYTTSLDSFGLEAAPCSQLLGASRLSGSDGGVGDGGAQLVQTLDFDVSDTIPGSMLSTTAPYVLFATGCPLSSNPAGMGDSTYCGVAADAGGAGTFFGDFHVYALQLDPTPGTSGHPNVQGVNGVTTNNYFPGIVPYAFDLGFLYGDAAVPAGGTGLLGDASAIVYLTGSADAGGQDQAFPSALANGALPPPTSVPSLGGVTWLAAVTSSYSPPGQPVFGNPEVEYVNPVGQLLQLSNLTEADLASGSTFTLLLYGDTASAPTTADGGANALAWNFRLIRNDKL